MSDKADAIHHFIQQAPEGQLQNVIRLLRKLIKDDALVNAALPSACHDYSLASMSIIEAPGGHKAILSSYNQLDETHFLDPIRNVIVEVDHVKQVVVGSAEAEEEPAPAKHVRCCLQDAADNYCQQHFSSGVVTVFTQTAAMAEAYYAAVVCSRAQAYNPRNFWSGRWRGVHKVHFASETQATVQSELLDHVHYYEHGNVYMEATHKAEVEVAGKDLAEVCQKVMSAISKCESQFHTGVHTQCTELSEGALKKLRRKLPVTKQLFDFGSNAHKLAAELTSTSSGNEANKI
mmetsp:Transcript_38834/g.69496  ORF Transcript_38834/g.69496 Transcript_38834/m.69496 type:complete len:290 (-) Transcript_38834:134-1003(-)